MLVTATATARGTCRTLPNDPPVMPPDEADELTGPSPNRESAWKSVTPHPESNTGK